MEQYQAWREANGMSRATTKYPKSSRPFFISQQAFDGLSKLAEQFGIIRGAKPSASALLEKIGLQEIFIQVPEVEDDIGYMDVDGLTPKQCYELGVEDRKAKRPMAFSTSALAGGRKRSRTFIKAYADGYASAFIDEELEMEPSIFDALVEQNSLSSE